MQTQRITKNKIEEYLAMNLASDVKYEFHNGLIYAMAGGTYNHGLICGNIFGEIRASLKKNNPNCTAILSEIKLHIASENSFVFPDTMVICGEVEKSAVDINSVINPQVIVEVLSKSTSAYDRGDKFHLYRQISSLKEYILIEQKKAQIEIYTKKSSLWKITRITGISESLYISSLDINIQLKDIYEGVDFEVK